MANEKFILAKVPNVSETDDLKFKLSARGPHNECLFTALLCVVDGHGVEIEVVLDALDISIDDPAICQFEGSVVAPSQLLGQAYGWYNSRLSVGWVEVEFFDR